MGKVIPMDLSGVTDAELAPDYVLEKNKGVFQSVLVIGFDHTGELIAASSHCDGGELLWLIEKFKQNLLSGVYCGE